MMKNFVPVFIRDLEAVPVQVVGQALQLVTLVRYDLLQDSGLGGKSGNLKTFLVKIRANIVTRPFCLVESHIVKTLQKRACSVLPHSHSVTTTSVAL